MTGNCFFHMSSRLELSYFMTRCGTCLLTQVKCVRTWAFLGSSTNCANKGIKS